MQLIDDPTIFRPLVVEAIKRYGFAPEHNLEWWLCNAELTEQPVFVFWPEDNSGLLTLRVDPSTGSEWYTFSEPLAAPELRGQRIAEFAGHILKNFSEIEEVIVETSEATRTEIAKQVSTELKLEPVDTELIWPIVNLKKFDPALPGGEWKGLRNIQSRFRRNSHIALADAASVDPLALQDLVKRWATNRVATDEVWPQTYLNLIDRRFVGTDQASVLLVDDQPVGFFAGWSLPHQPAQYYNGVALQDYSLRDLGLFMYLQILNQAKERGYETIDLGGVEAGGALNFKNRFLPESFYKTAIFSIVRQ